jgi:3-vinyl bacteriochlorophyllide hydratase
VVIKTLLLYTIMITGCDLGEEVFGVWLFARPSSGKTCSACWCWRCTPPTCGAGHRRTGRTRLMLLALAAYATYVINATQFLLKLRAARLQQAASAALSTGATCRMSNR